MTGSKYTTMWCLRQSTVESSAPKPGAHPTTSHTSQQSPQHLWAKEASLQGDDHSMKLRNCSLKEQKEKPVLPLHSKAARERTSEHTHFRLHACIGPWGEYHILNVPGPFPSMVTVISEKWVPLRKETCQTFTFAPLPHLLRTLEKPERERERAHPKPLTSDPQEKRGFNPEPWVSCNLENVLGQERAWVN